jgi:hypothetical protein
MQKSAAMEVNSEDGDRAPLHYWMRHDAAHHTGAAAPITNLAVMLSMIVHEIATNAAKYGALSNDTGTVTLDWEALEESDGRTLRMIWTEAGGPHVSAPVQSGFGSRLIECSARPIRRRGHRRLPAPRRRLHRDRSARQRADPTEISQTREWLE